MFFRDRDGAPSLLLIKKLLEIWGDQMKRTMSAMLAVFLLISVFCCADISATTEEFKVDGGVLLSYTGNATDIVIPPGVYYIGDSVFEGNTGIRSVDLGDVTIIGNKAFYGCTSLVEVKKPDKVKSCGAYVFYNTPYLSSADEDVILGSVLIKSNANGAYTVPDKVASIAPYAFWGNTGITGVAVSQNVTEICEGAFYKCSSLSTVNVSKNVAFIGAFAFEGTKWLSSRKDEFVTLGNNILIKYNGSTSRVTIPDGILQIAPGAFFKNTDIASVSFPSTLTSIGMRAFMGCTSLTEANITSGIRFIDKEAFANCTSLTKVVIPVTVEIVGDSVFLGCTSLKTAEFYSNSDVSDGLFTNCTSLELALISGKTERLGDYAFYGCKSLSQLSIPSTVSIVSDTVLSGAKKVTVYCFGSSFAGKQLASMGISVAQIGDANLDGVVNIKDATYVQKAVAGIVTAGLSNKLRGDADSSGELNVRDATKIQKIVAGIE